MRALDWESQLVQAIRDAAAKPFDAREWNCARFAHDVAQRVGGRELPFRRRGDLPGSVDAVLPRVDVALASRGDVVLADVPEPSLGVCLGRVAAFVGAAGLHTVNMRHVRAAWKV